MAAVANANQQAPTSGANNTDEKDFQYTLPSAETLRKAGDLQIKDEHGKEIPFKSLYENQSGRQLIVFIRHFFCGRCEDYVRFLAKNLPPSKLAEMDPSTTLTIVGCGQHQCIPDYIKRTSCPFKIYTDPTRSVYSTLKMVEGLGRAPGGPEYSPSSVMSASVSSIKNILMSGTKGFQGGHYTQNGGEWVFEGGQLKWCRRMKHSEDHTPMRELEGVLGVGKE